MKKRNILIAKLAGVLESGITDPIPGAGPVKGGGLRFQRRTVPKVDLEGATMKNPRLIGVADCNTSNRRAMSKKLKSDITFFRGQYRKWRRVMRVMLGEKVFREIDERAINSGGTKTFVDFCLEWAKNNKAHWDGIMKKAKREGPRVSVQQLEDAVKFMKAKQKKHGN